MKELINFLTQPLISFPSTAIAFFVVMKNARFFFGTKKPGVVFAIFALLGFTWAYQDPYFRAIVLWPDNVPIVILLVAISFLTWLSFYKGVQNDIRIENGEQPLEGTPENREKVWSWPNLVYTELFVIILGTAALITWSILLKAPLEEPANPTWAPNPAKAPWYFLGLQEMLVYFDPWMAGVILPVMIVVGLIGIPYMDPNPKGNGYYTFKERALAITMFNFGWLVLWMYLIIVGTFLRGPNWTFYGPFEFWDFHKVVSESNVNLSEYFWVLGLGKALPANIFIREIVGVVLTGIYLIMPFLFININWAKPQGWAKAMTLGTLKLSINQKYLRPLSEGLMNLQVKMGMIRFYIMMILILGMASLPVKMFLRWTITLKYIIAMPEFEFNL
jgi:hypothetical protein